MKNNQKHCMELFALLLVFILQTYALLVPFKTFPVFEIRKNLDLRKILVTPKIFLKSRFVCFIFLLTDITPNLTFISTVTYGSTS